MKATFSVIVPIYKVEDYVVKCIDSILSQTYSDFELILVDDGSPDKCPEICDSYQKKNNNVVVIHKKNGGLVSARNEALKVATGEYVCYVDGDDWVEPNLLETLYKKCINNQNPDVIIFNMKKQFRDGQETIPYYVKEGLYTKDKLKTDIYPYMMYDYRKSFYTGLVFQSAGGKAFKREMLLKYHCEDERISMGEDGAFVFQCLYNADKVYFLNEAMYIYNQLNVNSIVHSYDENRFENNRILINYLEKTLSGKEEYLDFQINAFKAYWLVMAVFHEVKSERNLLAARKHIQKEIKRTNALKSIKTNKLPLSIQMYLLFLKLHLYFLSLLAAKVISKIRG